MPSLKTFSLYSSAVESADFITMPYVMKFGDTIIEIDSEDDKYMVTSNVKLRVNADRCYFSEIKTNDLIHIEDKFIVFSESCGFGDIFLGHFIDNQKDIFVFRLPEKVSEKALDEIREIVKPGHGTKKIIYVNSDSVQYMDTKSIGAMMELMQESKDRKDSIWFYMPSYKFKTYLGLANIERMIPVKELRDKEVEAFTHSRQTARYMLAGDKDYLIECETAITVGRSDEAGRICLSDESVSRIHAIIVNIRNVLYVIDHCSTNFTYINYRKIPPYSLQQLKADDILVFGQNSYFKIRAV
jgi:hypothetical protein